MGQPLVVVVDHRKREREAVARVLAAGGYRVVLAEGPLEAFHALARGERPQAVVVSVALPGGGAADLVTNVRKLPVFADVRFVGLTATGERVRKNPGFDAMLPVARAAAELVPTLAALVRAADIATA